MAADGGLRRLFEKPAPENPTLLEALSSSSWNHRRHLPSSSSKDTASFTEIFGELHFQEKPHPPPPVLRLLPPPPPPPPAPAPAASSSWALDTGGEKSSSSSSKDDSSLDALLRPPRPAPVKRSASFCVKKTKSASASALLLCTEGLGSESTAVDVVRDDDLDGPKAAGEEAEVVAGIAAKEKEKGEKELEQEQRTFPPPIRSIASGGRGGKPSVCFRSFRAEGRFVLVEVVIPGKELLHASREGGRLRLQFAAAAAANV